MRELQGGTEENSILPDYVLPMWPLLHLIACAFPEGNTSTRIMVSKGTWHKTSTQNLRVFRRFWVLVTLIFSEIQYLLLETIPLQSINLKMWVLTLKNTLKNMGKWILVCPYFFGNPVLAIRDHTLRDHNACKTQFDRSLFLAQLSELN